MADPLVPAQQPAFIGEWQFVNTPTAPPSTNQVRLNNGTQTAATLMWVHKITANGIDATSFLSGIKKGQEIALQNKSDPTGKWQVYAVSGNPVDSSTHMEYPILWLRGGTAVPEQRAMLEIISVNVLVNVTAPPPMQASVGSVTALAKQSVVVPVTAPPPMQGFVGSVDISSEQLAPAPLPGYAFPSNTPAGFSPGMTLRQWYASQAMSGFISNAPAANLIGGNLAAYCFKVADSMIGHERREAKGSRLLTVSVNAPPKANPPTQSAPDSVSMKDAMALQKSQAVPVNGKGKRQGRLTTL